jgi:hypothetical protein
MKNGYSLPKGTVYVSKDGYSGLVKEKKLNTMMPIGQIGSGAKLNNTKISSKIAAQLV